MRSNQTGRYVAAIGWYSSLYRSGSVSSSRYLVEVLRRIRFWFRCHRDVGWTTDEEVSGRRRSSVNVSSSSKGSASRPASELREDDLVFLAMLFVRRQVCLFVFLHDILMGLSAETKFIYVSYAPRACILVYNNIISIFSSATCDICPLPENSSYFDVFVLIGRKQSST
mmetsp:Transcript_20852/g.39609  ORF Transcript_20852/g.39609 Transcript_20852/m.39609 type:complete len:169 (-) Transcript_20852:39-545(-)